MTVLRSLARSILFRHGWDTRARHTAAVRFLREATASVPAGGRPVILDVGCGDAGIAAFLKRIPVMGVDLAPPAAPLPNRTFTIGSITDLPFHDGAYPYVSCVDVLQALSPQAREQGVAEMLRVARDGVVIAAPLGRAAARSDARLRQALVARGAPVPPWIEVSLSNPHPTPEAVLAAIRRGAPGADVTMSYSENLGITRIVRAAAGRSRAMYALANLGFGLLSRAIPEPDADHAYRMVIVVQLGDPVTRTPGR